MPNIGFHMQRQAAHNWCWAAVGVSVDAFFDAHSRWRQCGMVKLVLGEAKGADAPPHPIPPCCAHPVPRGCNLPWYLEDALRKAHRLSGSPRSGRLSFRRIREKIDAGRPVCLRIGWRGGGGHFIVISGYHGDRTGRHLLDVEDPLYGPSTVELNTLARHYQRIGRWTHTYPV